MTFGFENENDNQSKNDEQKEKDALPSAGVLLVPIGT